MDLEAIRRSVITGICADDVLFEILVLKGGNALSLVHGLGSRSSLDVDFSMSGDFEDLADAERRIRSALEARFSKLGFVVFDFRFSRRPSEPRENAPAMWGGYGVEFKLIDDANFKALGENLEQLRRNARSVAPNQQRRFKIDISKHEYCDPKIERSLDDYTVYVYTPAMIAAEKLRALCQQLPEYRHRAYSTPRARDFYDVYAIVQGNGIDFRSPNARQLLRQVFAAKEVPLALLERVAAHRDFHEQDWPAVRDSITKEDAARGFEFYFDFVQAQISLLESFWDV